MFVSFVYWELPSKAFTIDGIVLGGQQIISNAMTVGIILRDFLSGGICSRSNPFRLTAPC